jgi:hypothetical protein
MLRVVGSNNSITAKASSDFYHSAHRSMLLSQHRSWQTLAVGGAMLDAALADVSSWQDSSRFSQSCSDGNSASFDSEDLPRPQVKIPRSIREVF